MNSKTKATLLKTVLAFALVFVLFVSIDIDFRQVVQLIKNLDGLYLALSLPGVLLVLFFKSIRWNELLKQTGIPISRYKSFASYMSAYSIGILTPGRVGEFVKVYNVRIQKEVTFLEAFKSVLADRLFDFVCLIMLGLAAFFAIHFSLNMYNGIALYIGFQLVGILGVFFIFHLLHFFRVRYTFLQKPLISMVYDSLHYLFTYKSIALWVLTWLAYLTYFVFLRFLLLAFGIQVSFIGIMNSMSLLSLVLLIPITLAGFGQRELSLVYLLGLYGVSAEIAVAFSLMQFALYFLWGGLAGLVFLVLNPIPIRVILEDVKQIKLFFLKK
jgi:uncharacterized membrane protein YbhN (UPF0104 family)